jgi:hypothetical protein
MRRVAHICAPTISAVHLRRAILLFALVLGLAALAAAVSPSREESRPALAPPSPVPESDAVPRNLTFGAGGPAGRARVRRARPGEHVEVSVASEVGGVATIPKLGLTASAAPDAPARFDLLAPQPGRYDVMLATSGSSEPRRVGTLVTRP